MKQICKELNVKEVQDEMFPKAQRTGIDMVALGAIILECKKELQAG